MSLIENGRPTPDLIISGKKILPKSERKKIVKMVKLVYEAADLPEAYLMLHFVKNKEIKELNHMWRGLNKKTDVLSFSPNQNDNNLIGVDEVIGDIVISIEQAQKQANKYGHKLYEEVCVLFVHGIMHLLGIDHEKSKSQAILQVECEMALLDKVGILPQLALTKRSL